ncbi:MAG: SprT-like domain-containing protein [Verrucomicrobiales bacterium]
MKFPQQLLLRLTGLVEDPPLRTPATPPVSPARSRRPRLHGEDIHLTAQARDLLRSLRGLRDLAAKVRVVWNSRLQTTAGTASARTWEVEINPRLKDHGPAIINRILRHELAHLVSLFRAGRRRIAAHGPEWRTACADLGIPGETRCHSLPLKARQVRAKFAYRCQHCGRLLKRVRPLERRSACFDCCQKHNRGRYDERYRYIRIPLDVLEEGRVQQPE